MAHASLGAPVREAMHDTSASKRSPLKPSVASDAASCTLPNRSVAPAATPAPAAFGLTKHTTSWPCCTKARTVARPMVPVAPSTKTRCCKVFVSQWVSGCKSSGVQDRDATDAAAGDDAQRIQRPADLALRLAKPLPQALAWRVLSRVMRNVCTSRATTREAQARIRCIIVTARHWPPVLPVGTSCGHCVRQLPQHLGRGRLECSLS